MRRPASLAVLIWFVATVTGVAQPYGTDMFVGSFDGRIYRLTPAGQVTTLGSYGTPAHPIVWDLDLDADDRNLVASMGRIGFASGYAMRIDIASGVGTTIETSPPRGIELDQNGDYLASVGTTISRISRDGSTVTTLVTGLAVPPFAQDVTTGDWIVYGNRQVLHYSSDFQSLKTTFGGPRTFFYIATADPSRSAVYLATVNIYRHDPGTGTTTRFPPAFPVNTGDQALVTDRAPDASGGLIYVGTVVNGAGRIAAVDRQGNQVATLGSFAQQVTGLAFDRSRNVAPILNVAPNDRFLAVSFAGDAGKTAVVAFGVSGCFPGVPLPDGRRIPLNPDALTTLTAAGPFAPLVVNNIGQLSASGRRVMQLNLNPLGNAIRGVPIWAVAITLDAAAPLGISQISRPLIIVP